jgi:membrane protease YdiL (CAAX protease family)
MDTTPPSTNPYDPPGDAAEPPAKATEPRPWGFWATTGFSLLAFFAFFVVNVAMVAALAVYTLVSTGDPGQLDPESFEQNGNVLLAAFIPAAVVGVALVLLFCVIRRGITLRAYLRWKLPTVGQVVLWAFVLALLITGIDLLSLSLGRRIVPEFVENLYRTAHLGPLLLGLLVAAPIYEELLFRGFMLEGFRWSKLGTVGAVLLTSLLWALVHFQYDWYGVANIFVMGIVLGAARLHSDSLILTVMLHSLANVVATVEVAVL